MPATAGEQSEPSVEPTPAALASSCEVTEDQLDWLENQSRPPAQAARTDLLLFLGYGLAAATVVAGLAFLSRYFL